MASRGRKSGIKKLKFLFTVVDRPKGEFYLDVLGQFEINCQMAVGGMGTATSELTELLGLNREKAVILSVVREDRMKEVMSCLEEKFKTVKNGKGIAFAVPFSSVIGVNMYQYLSNNRQRRGE